MSDIRPLSFSLGVFATRNSSGLFLSQSSFAQDILSRADMTECNHCDTPDDTKSKLVVGGEPVANPTLYRNINGAFQYLTFTCPDIMYVVQ